MNQITSYHKTYGFTQSVQHRCTCLLGRVTGIEFHEIVWIYIDTLPTYLPTYLPNPNPTYLPTYLTYLPNNACNVGLFVIIALQYSKLYKS